MFETCTRYENFASARLVTLVENELQREPSLFKNSSLLIQKPANVCSQLFDKLLNLVLQLERFSTLNNSC